MTVRDRTRRPPGDYTPDPDLGHALRALPGHPPSPAEVLTDALHARLLARTNRVAELEQERDGLRAELAALRTRIAELERELGAAKRAARRIR